jgi:acetyl-CoA carboxylase carboxyltransferase component
VTLRQAYGGAHIVMNACGLGATATYAWEGSQVGVMGGRQAVEVLERAAIRDGADPDELAAQYAREHLPAVRAAREGQIDELIEPKDTRDRVLTTLIAFGAAVRPELPAEPRPASRFLHNGHDRRVHAASLHTRSL